VEGIGRQVIASRSQLVDDHRRLEQSRLVTTECQRLTNRLSKAAINS
jgi:hypothetical protein